jgi:hypothetical protein
MIKKTIFFLGLLAVTASVFAQVREDTLIHVQNVMAARPDHAIYFKENFEMEIAGAGYTITDNVSEADYIIQLEVRPNLITYDDGTTGAPDPEESQYLLHLTLLRAEDREEVVAFMFPFTELEEMYQFNLFLVYEAMANVPITRLADIEIAPDDDRWRNKWIYLRTSIDFVITAYMLENKIRLESMADDEMPREINNHSIGTFVGATIGLEFQFLNWMSLETSLMARFSDPENTASFLPGLGLKLKFPLKPSNHFKLSPYIMGSAAAPTGGNYYRFPQWSIGGGFQFGAKGGSMGAFFIDANYLYSLGNVIMKHEGYIPDRVTYTSRNVISIGLGYKIGFIDRD